MSDIDANVDLSITTSPEAAYTPPDFRSQGEAYAQPGTSNAIDASTGLPQPLPVGSRLTTTSSMDQVYGEYGPSIGTGNPAYGTANDPRYPEFAQMFSGQPDARNFNLVAKDMKIGFSRAWGMREAYEGVGYTAQSPLPEPPQVMPTEASFGMPDDPGQFTATYAAPLQGPSVPSYIGGSYNVPAGMGMLPVAGPSSPAALATPAGIVPSGPSGISAFANNARGMLSNAGTSLSTYSGNARAMLAEAFPTAAPVLMGGMASGSEMATGYDQVIRMTESGNLYAPEQVSAAENTAAFGSTAGMLATLGGAAIGTAVGVGPIVGGAAGGIVSSAVTGAYGANQQASADRDQTSREAAQQLGAEMGAAAAQVREFTATISSAGAPVKEISTALSTVAGMGPGINGGTVGNTALMSDSLWQMYNPALKEGASFIQSNPFLMGLQPQFTGSAGRMSPGALGDLSVGAAFSGDYQASTGFLTLQEGASASPQRAVDTQTLREYQAKDNLVKGVELWGDGIRRLFGVAPTDDNSSYTKAEDAATRLGKPDPIADAAAKKTSDARDAAFKVYAAGRSAETQYGLEVGLAGTALQSANISGASDAELSDIARGVYGAIDQAKPALTSESASIDAYIAANPSMDPSSKLQLQGLSAAVKTQVGQNDLTGKQLTRTLFERSYATETGQFSASMARATMSGQTAEQMQGGVIAQADYLSDVARNGPLSPGEKSSIELSRMEMVFSNQQAQYTHEEGVIGVVGAEAGAGLSRAQSGGSPLEILQARQAITQNLVETEKQLNSELERGNLTDEQRLQKRQQIADIQGQEAQQRYASVQEFYGNTGEILSDQLGGEAATSARSILRGGNKAFDRNLLGDTQDLINNAREGAAHSKPGSKERAKWDRMAAEFGNEYQGLIDQQNTFSESAGERVEDTNVRGSFRRSMIAPFQEGADSNPFTKGLEVINLDRRRMAEMDQNRRQKQSTGLWRPEDEATYVSQRSGFMDDMANMQHDRLFAMFNAVPEMISGSPGGGIGAAVISPAALSAAFSPNPLVGGFGRTQPLQGGTPINPGGAQGSFSAGNSGDSHLLSRIASAVERMAGNGSGHPPNPGAPNAAWQLGLAADGYNPSARR